MKPPKDSLDLMHADEWLETDPDIQAQAKQLADLVARRLEEADAQKNEGQKA